MVSLQIAYITDIAMKDPPGALANGQRCQVWVHGTMFGINNMILDSGDLLLEAPNWSVPGDALILSDERLIGTAAASGLPDVEDHWLVVAALRELRLAKARWGMPVRRHAEHTRCERPR